MDFRDRRVWAVIGVIILLILLAWGLDWFGGPEAPTTPTPTR